MLSYYVNYLENGCKSKKKVKIRKKNEQVIEKCPKFVAENQFERESSLY